MNPTETEVIQAIVLVARASPWIRQHVSADVRRDLAKSLTKDIEEERMKWATQPADHAGGEGEHETI